MKQAARLTTFGNVPLLIISRDTTTLKQKDDEMWYREQETLKSLSPLSWRFIAKGAGHGVHHDRPDLVATEAMLVTDYLQGRATPPFGRTVLK